MRRLLIITFFLLGPPLLLPAQPREQPPVATRTIDFKSERKSVELTYAAVAWGPQTWDSIMRGVDIGGSRRWFFALLRVHGKASMDAVRLKSGRYALVLVPHRSEPPTIEFVKTRAKKMELPKNLRGEIPEGPIVGEVHTEFHVLENIVDPLEIELRPDAAGVLLHFRYGNQEMNKLLKFQ